MGSPYRPRIADAELGALQLAASSVLVDVEVAARQALAVDPALVQAGPRPRLPGPFSRPAGRLVATATCGYRVR
jgi:hypothetical protein